MTDQPSMSETDKILGFDQLRNLQYQVADLKTKLTEAIREREVDHDHLRGSLEQLEAARAGHGTKDLPWELKDLQDNVRIEVDWLKSVVLERKIYGRQ